MQGLKKSREKIGYLVNVSNIAVFLNQRFFSFRWQQVAKEEQLDKRKEKQKEALESYRKKVQKDREKWDRKVRAGMPSVRGTSTCGLAQDSALGLEIEYQASRFV